MHKIELLAPAGNFECLIAAVQSGADAVYISGKSFGARSFADNFDREELERAVDYCHLRNTKVYVTVNTLVYDDEIKTLEDYLVFLNSIGVDALIVQDMGVVKTANRIIPDMPLHASTQMTIHNSLGVKNLEKMGIKRVVLSRELSMNDIKSISEKTTAELEVFSHGALCMSYSGQCLMSSIIGGRSGNRGKCAQPCRLPYLVSDGKKKAFYMSLKDLCALEHIGKLKNIGVSSLKIEGRMKGPAYVAAVVGIYRKYIDNPQKVKTEDIEVLDRIFNRGGLTDGYLTGNKGKDMFAFAKPDNPYHKENDELVKSLLINENTENRKMKLTCRMEITEGDYPNICVSDGKTEVSYIYENKTETALKQPLTAENVCMRIAKTGGTPFEFSDIDVEINGNAFLTVSDINNIRRTVLDRFEKAYIKTFKRSGIWENNDREIKKIIVDNKFNSAGFVCEITNINQLDAVKDFPFVLFYVPIDIAYNNEGKLSDLKHKTALVLPAIMHESETEKYCTMAEELLRNGYCGLVASSVYLLERFKNTNLFGGFRLNVFNSIALEFLNDNGLSTVEVSPELNLKKIGQLKKTVPLQSMVYGRLPLMVTENCIIKNGDKCPCNNKGYITDRIGMKFPVIKDGGSCRNVVLNCKKTFMADKMTDIRNAGISLYRIYFTDETENECVKVCNSFFNSEGYCPEDYTRAHYYKGAE